MEIPKEEWWNERKGCWSRKRPVDTTSEVSSAGLLSVELSLDELARITSWGAGMQAMPDCYWDSDSRRLWNKLMKIRTDNAEVKNEP